VIDSPLVVQAAIKSDALWMVTSSIRRDAALLSHGPGRVSVEPLSQGAAGRTTPTEAGFVIKIDPGVLSSERETLLTTVHELAHAGAILRDSATEAALKKLESLVSRSQGIADDANTQEDVYGAINREYSLEELQEIVALYDVALADERSATGVEVVFEYLQRATDAGVPESVRMEYLQAATEFAEGVRVLPDSTTAEDLLGEQKLYKLAIMERGARSTVVPDE
jgi:hypothetical protein